MPQEFQVLRCCQCSTFQVHQVKKAVKWECKMCGQKQSIIKVYGRGNGIDCRKHVQKLNLMRGSLSNQMDDYTVPDKESSEDVNGYGQTFENKWDAFLEPQMTNDDENGESDEGEARFNYQSISGQFHQNRVAKTSGLTLEYEYVDGSCEQPSPNEAKEQNRKRTNLRDNDKYSMKRSKLHTSGQGFSNVLAPSKFDSAATRHKPSSVRGLPQQSTSKWDAFLPDEATDTDNSESEETDNQEDNAAGAAPKYHLPASSSTSPLVGEMSSNVRQKKAASVNSRLSVAADDVIQQKLMSFCQSLFENDKNNLLGDRNVSSDSQTLDTDDSDALAFTVGKRSACAEGDLTHNFASFNNTGTVTDNELHRPEPSCLNTTSVAANVGACFALLDDEDDLLF